MIDITAKATTLRKAVAGAVLTVSRPETIAAIEDRRVPKGDVFEFSRAAGLLAVKKTSDVIPDCHPLPVEFTAIRHRIEGLSVVIEVEVHTVYKTGVEVEAMHGAAVTALTMYDMLKPIDQGIEISSIRLIGKHGGKGDRRAAAESLTAAILVCSDTISRGEGEDRAGKAIVRLLEKHGVSVAHYAVLPDDLETIRAAAARRRDAGDNLVILTGGTGLSPRDVTPEAIAPLIDREIPGIMETARRYGQDRMPTAMLSRGLAGFSGATLLLTLPGSTKGAEETMAALFPQLLHVFAVRGGARHETLSA